MLPAWTNGLILKNPPETQTIESQIQTENIFSHKTTLAQLKFATQDVPGGGVLNLEFIRSDPTGPRDTLKFPDTEIVANAFIIGDNITPKSLNIRGNFQSNENYPQTIKLGVFTNYGNKFEPYDLDETLGTIQMGSQNKFFFKYSPAEHDQIFIVNPLIRFCSVFLKDINGINDIPAASVEVRNLDSIPIVVISNIPPDADGKSRGMLLFL